MDIKQLYVLYVLCLTAITIIIWKSVSDKLIESVDGKYGLLLLTSFPIKQRNLSEILCSLFIDMLDAVING